MSDLRKGEQELYERLWKTQYQASQCAEPLAKYVLAARTQYYGLRILDLGCGDGTTVRQIRLGQLMCEGLDITLAGVEISAHFLGMGQEKYFTKGCAWDMPFGDGEFGATISTDFLEHLPEKKVGAAIAEIVRVTRHKTLHVVATFPDEAEVDGRTVQLHKTVRPVEWWRARFEEAAKGRSIRIEIIDRKDFLGEV